MADLMAGGLCESSLEPVARTLLRRLEQPDLPPELRHSRNWPPQAQAEWDDDQGMAAAAALRERVVRSFRVLREAIDEFDPDLVLIWSKEQMENFGADCMPPFCIYAFDEPLTVRRKLEPEKLFEVPVHHAAARSLTKELLDAGFDVAYAYKPLHVPLAHTFAGLLSYLDWDQRGFPYPVVPFYVNSMGHLHLTRQGYSRPGELEDPPAPQPWRCFDLGAATARILRNSPWRAVLLAGSAWSHAAYLARNHFLWPDIEFDRARLAELRAGDYGAWRNLSRDALIDSGNNEFMSWIGLAGALHQLGLQPVYLDAVETWIFNSTKVTAVFK
jgi:hypothetical protein